MGKGCMFFYQQIIQDHLAGGLNEHVCDVTLSQSESQTKGNGRLELSEGILRFELIVEGKLPDRPLGPCYAEDMAKVRGYFPNGIAFSSDAVTNRGWNKSDVGYVVYKLHPSHVKMTRQLNVQPNHAKKILALEGFLKAVPMANIFRESSHITDDNPFFGTESSSADWFLYENERIKVAIRNLKNETWHVRVLPKDAEHYEAEALKKDCDRFVYALGVLCGQHLRMDARYVEHRNTADAELRTHHRRLGAVTSLVPPDRDSILLKLAADYVLDLPEDHLVFSCLDALWNSQANFWPLNYLLLASATEGLAKTYKPGKMSAKKRFAELARNLDIEISDKEFASWKRLRDALAHGSYGEIGDIREVAVHSDRIINIFNKILLRTIGYTGKYIDYSNGKPAIGEMR